MSDAAAVVGLALKKQKAKVSHLNVRDEKHGEEEVVLAVDVKVIAEMGNKVLDQLSPGLRAALYGGDAHAPGLNLEEDAHLTVVRFPQIARVAWALAGFAGAEFVVHGAKKDQDLSFNGDVDKLVLDLKEGGTVEVTFSVALHPSAAELADLSQFLGKPSKVSLRPVEQASQPPLEG